MPTDSTRPPVDLEVITRARADAEALGVPASAYIEAAIETADSDAAVATRAQAEIDAYRAGTAVPIADLAQRLGLTDDAPILLLRMGGWRDEDPAMSGPITRPGRGIAANQAGPVTAPAVRGYWRIAPPRGDATFVVGLRRGQVRCIGWGERWEILPGDEDSRVPRRYATRFWTADSGRWIDASTGDDGGALDQDQSLADSFENVIVLPDGNQNPPTWVGK